MIYTVVLISDRLQQSYIEIECLLMLNWACAVNHLEPDHVNG